MLKSSLFHKRNARIALAGMVAQILLSASVIILGRWSGTAGLQAAGFLGVVGVFAWAWLAMHQHLRGSSAQQPPAPPAEAREEDAAGEDGAADTALLTDSVSPILSLFIAIGLAWFGAALSATAWRVSPADRLMQVDPLRAMALMAGWCIVAFGITRFFALLRRRAAATHELGAGVKFMAGVLWAGVLFLVGFAAMHFGFAAPLRWVSVFVPVAAMVIGAEIGVFLFLDRFRPRRRGEEPRPAFDSRLLGLLLHSEGMGQTVWEALDYQFGFEASRSWLLRLCARSLWAWALLAGGTLLLASMIVIVEPHQQALLFRFGELRGDTLGPGLHWKAPWPVDSAVIHDVTGVRRIHVGSHRPETPGGEIYLADVPILWSNLHGVTAEEFLVVAPSADSLEAVGHASGKESGSALAGEAKPPSVNLMGGDIFVEYRIGDLRAFALASRDTESLFAQIAEAEASRELFRYDIDALLGNGRIEAENRLLHRLRDEAAAHDLGIEVLKVGFAGTHPPMDVADAFHETIIARQERLTAIQDAESYATRVKIEAAGTLEQADELIRGIDALEKGENAGDESGSAQSRDKAETLLATAGGRVAEAMAEARGYRWQRENEERGKSERFLREIELFRIAPIMFSRWQYLSTLEQGLRHARKFVLLADREKLVLRFNFANPVHAMQDAANAARRMSRPPVRGDSYDEDLE
jgi:regulator of protease activity HflC (stomatin/prohibitin superfamily)